MMLTMKKELLVSLSDIEAMSIKCTACQSQIRMPTMANINPDVAPNFTDTPALARCPVCLSPFESTMKNSIIGFQRAFANLKPLQIYFQINADALSSQQ